MTDEEKKLEKVSKLMETINSITSGYKSLYIEGDILTKFDQQYYTVTEFNDGVQDITYSSPKIPSKMLHEIDSYLNSWGLTLRKDLDYGNNVLSSSFTWTGPTYIRIELNTFHMDMIKFDKLNWFNYEKVRFEYLIKERFREEVKHNGNKLLLRELTLRELLEE